MENTERFENLTDAQLFEEYAQSREIVMRNYILMKNFDLIDATIREMSDLIKPSINKNDLVTFGVIGLMDAIQNFDPSLDQSFRDYAVTRIREEILDELKQEEWIPKSRRG
ncbi:MAG: sigma factor [Brevinema sp.]